ncbi:MAG: LEA type 2 family protein [Myxococcota bacterium]
MLLIFLLATGCHPRLPSATLDGVDLVAADLDHAEAELRIAVDNPLPVDLDLAAVRWEVAVRDHALAAGTVDVPQPLPADSVTVLRVPATVRFADLSAAYDDGVLGAPYRITGEVDLDTAFGTWTLPLGHEGTVPLLDPPTLDLVDVDVSLEGTGVRLAVALKLGLPEMVQLSALSWTVATPDAVLARGAAAVDTAGTLRMSAWLDPMGTAAAAAWAVYEGRGEVRIDLAGALTTPLGTVPVAVSRRYAYGE